VDELFGVRAIIAARRIADAGERRSDEELPHPGSLAEPSLRSG
jgi:hypothetical protein